MRQMSVALGGLLAALLLPLAVHLSGVPLALGMSGVLTAITTVAFALDTPHGPIVPPDARRRVVAPFAVLRRARHGTAAGRRACSTSSRSTTVLTFAVPALRDGGASRGGRQPAVRVRSASARWSRASAGGVSPMPAEAGGASRRCATSASWPAAPPLLTWVVWPQGTRRPDRGAGRAQSRRARLQRRALPDRGRDRGRSPRRAGRRADVDGALRRRRAGGRAARRAGRRRGLPQPLAGGGARRRSRGDREPRPGVAAVREPLGPKVQSGLDSARAAVPDRCRGAALEPTLDPCKDPS